MESERIPTMPQGMESERIPTMPQGMESERIPTMPQGMESERIPTMPQGAVGERIATVPQGMDPAGRVATIPQGVDPAGRVATVPQQVIGSPKGATGKNIVTQDMFFQGEKGGNYEIISCIVISANSGESQIYACNRQGDDEKYVARVLTSITPQSEPEKLQSRGKVIQFLDRVKGHPNILPLVDYATVNIGGKAYFVEVYPYCEGGDMSTRQGKISYAEITKEIVPAVNEALKAFHDAGFVHRDIKPDNLYRYKGKLVIGDFGITCDLREDGFATDRYKTGTLGYYAPELMSQAAIAASDYYSFGQTIWTLYSGEMMYKNLLRMYKEQGVEEQRNQINFAMLNSQYYGLEEINKEDAFLEVLIRGLLQYDPKERFDYRQVRRWLAGDRTLSHEIVSYKDERTFTRGLKIDGKVCWDNEDICNALFANWDAAKYHLYSGALKDFYASQDFATARFMDGIMKAYATSPEESAIEYINDIGLAKVLLYLSGNKVLYWRRERISCLEDISLMAETAKFAAANQDNSKMNSVVDLLGSELLEEWYRARKNPQESVLSALQDMREMLQYGAFGNFVAVVWASMCFLKDQSKVEIYGCKEISQVAKYMTRTAADMYVVNGEGNLLWVDNPMLAAFLCNKGYQDAVKLLLQQKEKDLWMRYEDLNRILESVLEGEDRVAFREKCYKYGPRSFFFWWKNNLSIYEFVGEEALLLKQQIEAVQADGKMSLQLQAEKTVELYRLYMKFRDYDVSDIFLAELGLIVPKEKSYIRAKSIEGVWDYSFLGIKAPIGYKYYLGI